MADKKLKSSFINMILSLGVIATISALGLGYTYQKTKPYIEKSKAAKKSAAIAAVLVPFDNNPADEMFTNIAAPGTEFYPAYKTNDGKRVKVGTAVKTSVGGFSEDIVIMAGIDTNYHFIKIVVLEQKETPGLGTELVKPKFIDQFNALDPNEKKIAVKQDDGDIDAITAATISSRAFCRAANKALTAIKDVEKVDCESAATKLEESSEESK